MRTKRQGTMAAQNEREIEGNFLETVRAQLTVFVLVRVLDTSKEPPQVTDATT